MSARVLVVDDILPNVKLLEAKLSSEYFDVLTATNGPDALEIAERDAPDIVLLDVMMPGMDGFEVCERLKNNAKTAHIPVVMVTALTDATDRVRGLESGADDFLSKPLNDTALMARVRSLVRLKMTVDEWRIRETTANQFGIMDTGSNAMMESAAEAKVLIVEDKTFESDKFIETLDRDNDMVMPVLSGEQAIILSQEHEFDLITVSLNMEQEDGLRLVSHLRSNERTRSVPILMVGMEEDMKRIAQGLEIGAHDYILRPVDRNELLARVRTQVRRKRYQERLRSNYEHSLNMALTDSLTGLFNRRYLNVHFGRILANIAESRKPIGVLMLDIDNFKIVNDTYGHNVGDEILKQFADRIVQRLRSFDLVARQGGEEFVAILPDINPKVAMQVSERLRKSIGEEPFKVSTDEGLLTCTVSIGGAIIDDPNIAVEEALKKADDCLYEAKEGGRNQSIFAGYGRVKPEMYMNDEQLEELAEAEGVIPPPPMDKPSDVSAPKSPAEESSADQSVLPQAQDSSSQQSSPLGSTQQDQDRSADAAPDPQDPHHFSMPE